MSSAAKLSDKDAETLIYYEVEMVKQLMIGSECLI